MVCEGEDSDGAGLFILSLGPAAWRCDYGSWLRNGTGRFYVVDVLS